jgi:tetratricopeptide (TPR) repeat protein
MVATAQSPSADATTQYTALLKHVQQGDMTINFRSFRIAGALMIGQDGKLAAQSDRATFRRLLDAGSLQEALDSANRNLERNYANAAAHFDAFVACSKLNKPAEAALHRKIFNALLDSIQRSGDGKTPETAWFVVTISEEYALLQTRLGLQQNVQALVNQNGHAYDRLEVVNPKTNEKQVLWFNTDFDLGQYHPPAPRTPEENAKLQHALQLYLAPQTLTALPLIQELAAGQPEDATLQWILADCLSYKADTNVTPEESVALLKQVREHAERARQLGDNSPRLSELLARVEVPEIRPRKFSEVTEADKAMKDGEQALGTGDYDAAMLAYSNALKFDPKLYLAAMYTGEMFFREKDPGRATPWFLKAAELNPASPMVYRHWGDELMLVGRTEEARDKYIEAIITLPANQSWASLIHWAARTNHQLSPPKIDRPPANQDSGSVWASYTAVRTEWKQSLFAQKYPAEPQYRHTLEEETAALESVAAAVASQKPANLDPQLATLCELKNAGLLQAWILFTGVDADIIGDYPAYRETHRRQLRTYLEKYVIQNSTQPVTHSDQLH